jgi:type IV secretory pathway VirJ component
VVGWDSLRYFWRRKTPEQAAADLAAVIDAYERKWGCDEIALIGYSFGADAMPSFYSRLDAAMRKRVAMISILSSGEAADWDINVDDWLGVAATPLGAAVATLPGDRTQCFFGDRDEGRTCDLFAVRGAEIFPKSGAHQMDGDYDRLGREIADGISRRLRDKCSVMAAFAHKPGAGSDFVPGAADRVHWWI